MLPLFTFLILNIFFPQAPVTLYGDETFVGANVYADNKFVGEMVLDEDNNKTYARDKNVNNGLINIWRIWFPDSKRDRIKIPANQETIEFKIVARDGNEFGYQVTGVKRVEDREYRIEQFEVISYSDK